MSVEWFSNCKDCGKEFGYSDGSYRLAVERGLSRPERCPKCRQMHSREISTLGLSHFELTPLLPIPLTGLASGKLGKIERKPRPHIARPFLADYDFEKFGIKENHINSFFDVMQRHQVVVVVAPTGAGKSTLLPYRLMVPPKPFPEDLWTRRGQIVITQPRIQATRNIPDFVATKLHGSSLGAGYDVGFKHSGSPATDRRNKLVYMTDGSLINMIARNEIGALSVIMIDEAHERSLNIDLILGLLKEQLPKYPHLKLIIASATIDSKKFLTYYGAPDVDPDGSQYRTTDIEGNLLYKNDEIAKVLQDSPAGFYGFPGKRQHPVITLYRSDDQEIKENRYVNAMPEEVSNKVVEILLAMISKTPSELTSMNVGDKKIEVKGDILAFLHGEKPIKEAVELIVQRVAEEPSLSGKVDVLPLYSKLSQAEQDRALKPKEDPRRIRVVVSTNVAETSLTVEGIVHVVDSGLIYEKQWDSKTQTTYLTAQKHSQAGCKQRWGRAGRIQPGMAHCLYSENQFKATFPEYTLAEIARSPIDQLILTAKAAGVSDINRFDWIQPPSPQELQRAPAYLQQIGAVDRDGDLTSHGLELRSFPAELEYANLMILADRFGCAVEMATILPMLELGGYAKLLRWERSWDAPTKRTVYGIQRGLIEPCEDDVEFYLKLWDAWEGTRFNRSNDNLRKQWAEHFFLNNEIFQAVDQKRSSFLDSLSGHKKSDEIRPVSFELLDRVRIIMTYGLCNQIYFSSIGMKDSNDPINYQAYIAHPERHPELVELHKDAKVQISRESVLHGRIVPSHFVCGKRQRQRQYVSALTEPETIILASFIAKINPAWLEVVEQPIMQLVQLVHQERERQAEKVDLAARLNKLFIDQFYPVGSICVCSPDVNGTFQVERRHSTPVKISATVTYEEIEEIELLNTPEAEGELDPNAGVKRKDSKIAVTPEEDNTEIAPIWSYLVEDDERYRGNKIELVEDRLRPQGVMIADTDRISVDKHINAIVTGYVCVPGTIPLLKLRPVLQPDPYKNFQNNHAVGEAYEFEIVGVEHYVNDPLAYLIVRDPISRLEISLDPFDVGLTGRNYAVDYLDQYKGKKIFATVEQIRNKGKQVRLSRLPQAEEQMLRFLGKGSAREVEAGIMEVNDNGMYLWLVPDKTEDFLPCGGFVRVQRLPNRPTEMERGKICKVRLSAKNFKKRPPTRSIKSLPKNVEKSLNSHLGNNLDWDSEQNRLSATGRINYKQRNELLALSEDPDYQRALHILFRRSNEFELDVIDLTGQELLLKECNNKGTATVKILKVDSNGVLVITDDDFEIYLKYQNILATKGLDLTDYLLPGNIRNLNVRKNDQGELEFNILRAEENPQLLYPVGSRVVGTVSYIFDDGSAAFVMLQPGMKKDAYLSSTDVTFGKKEDLRKLFKLGQPIDVRVIENTLDPIRFKVSCWRLYSEQRMVPQRGFEKLRSASTKVRQDIENETQTSIGLDDNRVLTVEGPILQKIQDAIKLTEKVAGILFDPLAQAQLQETDEFSLLFSKMQAEASEASRYVPSMGGQREFESLLKSQSQEDSDGETKLYRKELIYSSKEFEYLVRQEGNEFEKLFQLEQNLIAQITEQNGIGFELLPDKNTIVLVGNSQARMEETEEQIKQALK